jgi:3-hydroxyisobutyrate dehydrogenase
MQVAFLGLGVMGYPMAGHLQKAGHQVTVYNRTRAKADAWAAEFGGKAASTPREAASGQAIVFACVGNDDDLRAIALGDDGAYAGMSAGALFVDHTTASAEVARELGAVAQSQQIGFMDAPVSGGQQGAENGALTVMVGGASADFETAAPVIDAYARACTLMGEVGAGQLTKMVNQICIAGLVEALSEGLSFARAAGLDAHKVVDVISKGAAQSWQMENRYKTMLDDHFTYGFAVDWMRKDLSICLAEARKNGAALPITATVDQLYGEVQAMGGGRWDTSSLFARLEAMRNSRGG